MAVDKKLMENSPTRIKDTDKHYLFLCTVSNLRRMFINSSKKAIKNDIDSVCKYVGFLPAVH